jgi:hypothetical protein
MKLAKRSGRVVQRPRIKRRDEFTRNDRKDRTLQRMSRLNRGWSKEMMATAKAIMLAISAVLDRSVLHALGWQQSCSPRL